MTYNSVDLSISNPDQELITQLELATLDLLWLSETEYPIQVVYWDNAASFSQNILLQQHNLPADTKIVIKEIADFFANVTRKESWHNEAEQVQVEKYQILVNLLTENLRDLQVYLLGNIEIWTYIIGTTQHQAIAGLVTKTVAT